MHDFQLFKLDRMPMLPEQLCLADKGYQGLAELHANSCTPTKKPRKQKLDKDERQHNRLLSRLRIVVEHVNRRLKIFRISALALSQPPPIGLTVQPDCSYPQL